MPGTGMLGSKVGLHPYNYTAGTPVESCGAPQPLAVPRALPSGAAAAGAAPVLAGLRLGVFREWFEDADAEVVAACHRAVDLLVDRGAQVLLL